MKTRKVTVTLELETDATLSMLRNRDTWQDAVYESEYGTVGDSEYGTVVTQVQVHVVQPAEAPKHPKGK